MEKDEQLKSLIAFALTSSKQEQDIVSAYNLNVAGYVIKPVEFNAFLENIKRLNLYWSLIELPHENN